MAPIAERFVRLRPDMSGFGVEAKRGIDDSTDWDGHGKRQGKRLGVGFASGAGAAIGTGFRAIAVGAAGLAGAGFAIKRGLIDPASDLGETVNKTNVVFGRSAPEIQKWAKTAATSFGLSNQAALAAASQFGDMFQQLGFTGQAATQASKGLVKTAADLGSFHNVDPTDVLDRIGSALRGEYDSLQQLIPNINAARVEQEALAETGKKSAKELTAQEKATAALAIVQRDGANAANDFAETSSGAANQQRILSAQVEDLRGKLGTALLPAFAGALGGITAFITGIQGGKGPAEGFGAVLTDVGVFARKAFDYFRSDVLPRLQDFAGFLGSNVVPVVRQFVDFIADRVVPVVKDILSAALDGARSAFDNIRGAIERNRPQIESMVDAFKTAAGFILDKVVPLLGPILQGALRATGIYIGTVIDVIAKLWGGFQTLVRIVGPALAAVLGFALDAFGGIVNGAAKALGWIPGFGPKVRGAAEAFNGFKARADEILGAMAKSARGFGLATADGLAEGIAAGSGRAVTEARAVANRIKGQLAAALEVASPSKATKRIGRYVVDGLVEGLQSGKKSVADTTTALAKIIRDKLSGDAESGLLSYLKKQSRALRAAERDYESAVEGVKTMNDALKAAIGERDQFGAGIASSLRGEAGILSGLEGTGEDNPASAGGLAAFMRSQLNSLREFASNLASLTARGLSSRLVGEIAGGGLGRGGLTARLLAGSDAATLQTFNALQNEIDAVTSGIGARTADTVFGGNVEGVRADLAASELQLRRANSTLDALADKTGDAIVAALRRAGVIATAPVRVGV